MSERGVADKEGVSGGTRVPPSGLSEHEYIASLPDKEAADYITRRLQEWAAEGQRRDIARGITPYRAPVKTRTVPLPLEIVFRPDVRGTYNSSKGTWDDDSTSFYFDFEPRVGDDQPVVDGWEMREQFLLPEDSHFFAGLDGITLAFGRFGVGREDVCVPHHKLPKPCHVLDSSRLLNEEFHEWQSLIRASMTTKMIEWPNLEQKFPAHKVDLLCQPMRLAVEWQDGRPAGIIRCSGVLQALVATLQVDALMNAEYRFCACVGCHKGFKVKRKDQRYCDERCKHKQVVRDGRARQSKAAKQTKIRSSGRKEK